MDKRIAALIRKATTTGEHTLDPSLVSELESVLRKSPRNVDIAVPSMMQQLAKRHSQIRLLLVLLINHFFNKSKRFRMLFLAELPTFLDHAIGTASSGPSVLPPPLKEAEMLRAKALEVFGAWHARYGKHRKELRLAHTILQKKLKIIVPDANSAAVRREEEQTRQHATLQQLLRAKFAQVQGEMDTMGRDVEKNIREMNSCCELLQPRLEDLFGTPAPSMMARAETKTSSATSSSPSSSSTRNPDGSIITHDTLDGSHDGYGGMRAQGLANATYELEVVVPKQMDASILSEEQSPMVDALKEGLALLRNRHTVLLNDWYDTLIRLEPPEKDKVLADRLLKRVIDLRSSVDLIRRKCAELGIRHEEEEDENRQRSSTPTTGGTSNEYFRGDDQQVCTSSDGESISDGDSEEDEFDEADIEAEEAKVGYEDRFVDLNRHIQEGPLEPEEEAESLRIRELQDPTVDTSIEKVPQESKDVPSPPKPNYVPYFLQKEEEEEEAPSELTTEQRVEVDDEPSHQEKELREDETRQELLARATVVPYDTDLMFWGQKHVFADPVGLDIENKWTGSSGGATEKRIRLEDIPGLSMRVIAHDVPREPVTRACRAPLNDGTLCPRHDREVCPFHGKIVPRDASGRPLSESPSPLHAPIKVAKRQLELRRAHERELRKEKFVRLSKVNDEDRLRVKDRLNRKITRKRKAQGGNTS